MSRPLGVLAWRILSAVEHQAKTIRALADELDAEFKIVHSTIRSLQITLRIQPDDQSKRVHWRAPATFSMTDSGRSDLEKHRGNMQAGRERRAASPHVNSRVITPMKRKARVAGIFSDGFALCEYLDGRGGQVTLKLHMLELDTEQ